MPATGSPTQQPSDLEVISFETTLGILKEENMALGDDVLNRAGNCGALLKEVKQRPQFKKAVVQPAAAILPKLRNLMEQRTKVDATTTLHDEFADDPADLETLANAAIQNNLKTRRVSGFNGCGREPQPRRAERFACVK